MINEVETDKGSEEKNYFKLARRNVGTAKFAHARFLKILSTISSDDLKKAAVYDSSSSPNLFSILERINKANQLSRDVQHATEAACSFLYALSSELTFRVLCHIDMEMLKTHNLSRIHNYMSSIVIIDEWMKANPELKKTVQEEEKERQLAHD